MYLRRRRAVAAVFAAVSALSLTGCVEADNGNNTLAYAKTEQPSAPSTPPGNPQSTAPARPGQDGGAGGAIDLEANDNNFVPKDITAAAGDITIEMRNTGLAPHTFTNKAELNVDVNANAGQNATIKLTGVKAGTYKIICVYHETIGMVGTLTVT